MSMRDKDKLEDCKCRFAKWFGYRNGVYRLQCCKCHKVLCESSVPPYNDETIDLKEVEIT